MCFSGPISLPRAAHALLQLSLTRPLGRTSEAPDPLPLSGTGRVWPPHTCSVPELPRLHLRLLPLLGPDPLHAAHIPAWPVRPPRPAPRRLPTAHRVLRVSVSLRGDLVGEMHFVF